MKVSTKKFKEEYENVKNLDLRAPRDENILFWLVHPEIDREKPVKAWKNFLEGVRESKSNVILSPSELISEELEKHLLEYDNKDNIYSGGFLGKDISYLDERKLPNYEHYLLGWRIDWCLNDQINYLMDSDVPEEKLNILERYSFSGKDKSKVEKAIEDYKAKGLEVFPNKISELI